MLNDLLVLLVYGLVLYFVTLGLALAIGQKRGALAVHRFWVKSAVGTLLWICRTIGDLFHWVGRKRKL